MINRIEYRNFKVLRDATLPLQPFTLLIGANGSGKSTALEALTCFGSTPSYDAVVTRGPEIEEPPVQIQIYWGKDREGCRSQLTWRSRGSAEVRHFDPDGKDLSTPAKQPLERLLKYSVRIYSLEAAPLANPVQLQPQMELRQRGQNLAGVLDRLRDNAPERFEELNSRLPEWIPDFDRILFETPNSGRRSIKLRVSKGGYVIPANDLSHGTLFALAMLTLAHLPDPPQVVALEEPGRGLHPRLLPKVREALYRLSYPEEFREDRDPVQVIATTHSPYFLDLYKERPEEIVIAEKRGLYAKFQRLSDRPDVEEILEGAPLGEVWYTGVLGGVPSS